MGRTLVWSEKHEARLLSLAPQATVCELARTFGVTRYAIETKLSSLGVAPLREFRWTIENVDRLRSLAAVDTPHAHMAAHLGCSVWAVRHKLERLRTHPEDTDRICAEYSQTLASGNYASGKLDRMMALSRRRETLTRS